MIFTIIWKTWVSEKEGERERKILSGFFLWWHLQKEKILEEKYPEHDRRTQEPSTWSLKFSPLLFCFVSDDVIGQIRPMVRDFMISPQILRVSSLGPQNPWQRDRRSYDAPICEFFLVRLLHMFYLTFDTWSSDLTVSLNFAHKKW